jgi:threonine synthase
MEAAMNHRVKEMRCIRCNAAFPVGDYLYGCPHCRGEGHSAAVTFTYRGSAEIHTEERGLKRYTEFLPYTDFPTLGEGGTPVVSLPGLANSLGLGALYSKNEFQNPSGSHKDRMNPQIVARAKDIGAATVACASSGNEAASLALYAAAGGIRCVNVASKNIADGWRAACIAPGAELVIVDSPAQRQVYLKERIEQEGWYCATNQLTIPVSSSSYGIQGYKTIAYELFEHFKKQLPDFVLVPTCRGDLLYGIYEGFQELVSAGSISRMPRLVAVEPIPRLERVLAGEDYRTVFDGESGLTPSIGGLTSTYQSELALRSSGGFAVSVPQSEVLPAVSRMAEQGLYLETSSAVALPCIKKALNEETLPKGSSALIIATSHGYKNNTSSF